MNDSNKVETLKTSPLTPHSEVKPVSDKSFYPWNLPRHCYRFQHDAGPGDCGDLILAENNHDLAEANYKPRLLMFSR